MTGSTNYLVRPGFTQEAIWRDALGNSAPLLIAADTGECLDAPEYVPAGSMVSSRIAGYKAFATFAGRE